MAVPLELRAAALVILGVFGYAANVAGLAAYGMDMPLLYGDSTPPRVVAENAYREGRFLAFLWAIGAAMTWLQARFFGEGTDEDSSLIPWVTFIVILAYLLRPAIFRHTFFRIIRGGLSRDHRLGDVLLSDALVSYAGVIVELALAVAVTVEGLPGRTIIDRTKMGQWVLLAGTIPYGIRIKQCFLDWRRTNQLQHLANLFKYVSSNVTVSLRIHSLSNLTLLKYVPVAMIVSTVYSLVWDIVYDWRLGPKEVRERRFPSYYYTVAIILDVVLRFAWLAGTTAETRIFGLQLAELFRRWVWIFLRVESEPAGPNKDIELPVREFS